MKSVKRLLLLIVCALPAPIYHGIHASEHNSSLTVPADIACLLLSCIAIPCCSYEYKKQITPIIVKLKQVCKSFKRGSEQYAHNQLKLLEEKYTISRCNAAKLLAYGRYLECSHKIQLILKGTEWDEMKLDRLNILQKYYDTAFDLNTTWIDTLSLRGIPTVNQYVCISPLWLTLRNDEKLIIHLLNKGADPNQGHNLYNQSFLLKKIQDCTPHLLEILLAKGAHIHANGYSALTTITDCVITILSKTQYDPILLTNHFSKIKILLENGAHINEINWERGKNHALSTLKTFLIHYNLLDPQVKTLSHKISEDSYWIHTQLSQASYHINQASIDLIKKKIFLYGLNKKNYLGKTILHLIVSNECDINSKTPLMLSLLRYVLDQKACVNNADYEGNTPLHYAVQKTYKTTSFVEMLLQQGADPSVSNCYDKKPTDYTDNPLILNMLERKLLLTID
jgi:ankyrin repeat protein